MTAASATRVARPSARRAALNSVFGPHSYFTVLWPKWILLALGRVFTRLSVMNVACSGQRPRFAPITTFLHRLLPSSLRLCGVGLFVAGARGAQPADSAERVVDLPPFIFEEALKAPSWRFAEAPGLEILSRCPDYVSRHLGEEIARLNSILRLLIPEELQIKFSAPTVIIATTQDAQNTAVWQKMIEETIALERKRRGVGDDEISVRDGFLLPSANRIRSLANMRLWDKDEVALLFVLQERDF